MNQDNQKSNMLQKKSNKKLVLLISTIVAVIIVVTLIITNSFKTEKDYDYDNHIDNHEKQEKKEKAELLRNIKYKVEAENSTELLISIENNNKEYVNVEIPVRFYDENKTQIASDDAYVSCLESNSKLYTIVDTYDKNIASYEYEIVKDKIEISASEKNSSNTCVSYNNKYKTSLNIKSLEKTGSVEITNLSEETITYDGMVLYYKDNKIINFESVLFDIVAPNSKAREEITLPRDENYDPIVFDKVEFGLNAAEN